MQPGYRVGQFVLERQLGEGGMAEVWLARNVHLGSYAAVKFLNSQYASRKDIEERFLNEGRRQGALDHPNIVKVYGFDYADGRSFLIMQFVDGEPLDVRLQRSGPMTPAQAIPIAYGVLQALDFAHTRHIVHRDVKPSNILIDGHGTPYLGDFGIVLAVNEKRLTQTGTVMGTPHYMSPEQIARPMEVDQRSDIYSFGCVLYEMLTGATPFDHVSGSPGDTDFAVKMAHLQTPPPLPRQRNAAVPEALEQVIMRCLAKSPAHRFANCGQVRAALEQAMAGTPGPQKKKGSAGAVLAAVAGSLLLAAAAGAFYFWPKQPVVSQFTVSPAVVAPGQPALLSWDVDNARVVEIAGLGKQPPKGTMYVRPSGDVRYALTGKNLWKSAGQDVLVSVSRSAVIRKYELNPTRVRPNEPATLTWDVANATEVTIGGKRMQHSGTATVREPSSASFTLRATGPDGVVRQDRRVLEVVTDPRPGPAAPRVLRMEFVPNVINQGANTELHWEVSDATTVYIGTRRVDAKGSIPVQGLSRNSTATLTATGPGGRATGSAEVKVNVANIPRPLPTDAFSIRTFRAEQASANGGTFFNLHYDAPGATRIEIQPEAGRLSSTRGIVSVFPTGPTTYTLYAYSRSGERIEQTVTVQPPSSNRTRLPLVPVPASGMSWDVMHHHAGDRATYCHGTLFIRDGRLVFQSASSNDGFDVPFSDVAEVKANRAMYGNYRAFHVKTGSRNLNFVPRQSVDTVVAQINRAIGQ